MMILQFRIAFDDVVFLLYANETVCIFWNELIGSN